MEKMGRELQDIANSREAVLGKLSQLGADTINLGNLLLEKGLPEIHHQADTIISEVKVLMESFTATTTKFIADNRLDKIIAGT
jgi:hypothetical protein